MRDAKETTVPLALVEELARVEVVAKQEPATETVPKAAEGTPAAEDTVVHSAVSCTAAPLMAKQELQDCLVK